jgi:hypothetical protein
VKILLSDGDRRLALASGYGRLAAGLDKGLPHFGHTVIYGLEPGIDVCLYTCPPSSMKPEKIPFPTAAFTMHELEHLPPKKAGWVDVLNRLDLVITPTEWNAEAWRRFGVRTPIAVVPLGVDLDDYHLPKTREFTVLTVHENLGSESSRENWEDTLTAFFGAFRAGEPARLLVKTWKWKPQQFEKSVERLSRKLGIEAHDRPVVQILDADLPPQEMRSLYQQSWLFLKNANREGWGLPATEAVACGATIAASRIEPLLSHLPEDTYWFNVGDVTGLSAIMRSAYSSYEHTMARAYAHNAQRTSELVSHALIAHLQR